MITLEKSTVEHRGSPSLHCLFASTIDRVDVTFVNAQPPRNFMLFFRLYSTTCNTIIRLSSLFLFLPKRLARPCQALAPQ